MTYQGSGSIFRFLSPLVAVSHLLIVNKLSANSSLSLETRPRRGATDVPPLGTPISHPVRRPFP